MELPEIFGPLCKVVRIFANIPLPVNCNFYLIFCITAIEMTHLKIFYTISRLISMHEVYMQRG